MDRSTDLAWRKSTLSGTNENCVEVAELADGGRAVRNSKRPEETPIEFTPGEWEAFIGGVKLGEFD